MMLTSYHEHLFVNCEDTGRRFDYSKTASPDCCMKTVPEVQNAGLR
jgi:hypothetical protein